jgi:hypothetical protein
MFPIIPTDRSDKDSTPLIQRLKQMSLVERNAAIAFLLGASPKIEHPIVDKSEASHYWKTNYFAKANKDVTNLSKHIAISVSMVLMVAENVYIERNVLPVSSQIVNILNVFSDDKRRNVVRALQNKLLIVADTSILQGGNNFITEAQYNLLCRIIEQIVNEEKQLNPTLPEPDVKDLMLIGKTLMQKL